VNLANDFDPAFEAGIKKKEDGVALLEEGIELPRGVPGAAGRSGHVRGPSCASSARCRGQGRDHPPRDERRQPAGRAGRELQGPVSARSSTRTSCAATSNGFPSRGEIGIFNRSHYEEVLVVRVHPEILLRQQLPAETRETSSLETQVRSDQRLGAVSVRERVPDRQTLSEPLEGGAATALSSAHRAARSQLEFLLARREERQFWDSYQEAFSEMFSHTSTACAPWYVIPADRKWFARIAAAAVIAHTLIDIDPHYPTLDDSALRDLQAVKMQLESEAPSAAAPKATDDAARAAPARNLTKTGA